MTTETKTADKTASTSTDNLETLSAEELKTRKSCEASIRNGLKAYWRVGQALTVIAQDRLYRSTHSTMAKYAREAWDMTTARVSQYQHAFRVHQLFEIHGVKTMPKTESQCRPLVRIPQDENADSLTLKAWELACVATDNKITAKAVNDAVDSVLGIKRESASTEGASSEAGDTAGQSAKSDTTESASAEMRAQLREARRKIAYLESALAAEKAAHKRTASSKGFPTSAKAQELYRAGFRAMAKKYHPDHGGSDADMAELNEIKETLFNAV